MLAADEGVGRHTGGPMRKGTRARLAALLATALFTTPLGACGDDDEQAESTTTTAKESSGSATVEIEYVDYGYAVSGPLVAGGTMQLKNSGKEFHMMGIGRLKPGKTLDDLKKVLAEMGPPGGGAGEQGGGEQSQTQPSESTTTGAGQSQAGGGQSEEDAGGEGEEQDPTAEVLEELGLPGNVMSPGESADVTVPDLQPGNYALVCFIPTEGEGAPHFTKGMLNELQVVEGDAPEPTADVTYKVTPGKAVEGPAMLTSGRHTLKFEAAAGSEQLEPQLGRLAPGKTFNDLDTELTKLFESEEPPPKGAAARVSSGQLPFAGFDLRNITKFYLALDFRPATYVLLAEDADKEDRAKPPKEMITITVT